MPFLAYLKKVEFLDKFILMDIYKFMLSLDEHDVYNHGARENIFGISRR